MKKQKNDWLVECNELVEVFFLVAVAGGRRANAALLCLTPFRHLEEYSEHIAGVTEEHLRFNERERNDKNVRNAKSDRELRVQRMWVGDVRRWRSGSIKTFVIVARNYFPSKAKRFPPFYKRLQEGEVSKWPRNKKKFKWKIHRMEWNR